MPGTLFAAMAAPTPVPHTITPLSARPALISSHTNCAMSGKSASSVSVWTPRSVTSCSYLSRALIAGPFIRYPA